MDSRKVTFVVAVVAIALLAVGIGYAYSATTVTNTNSITQTNIEILPYSEDPATAAGPDYTGSAQNVVYNEYNNAGEMTYNFDGAHDLSEIKNIVLKWVNPTAGSVTLSALTMKVSNDSIYTYLDEHAGCIVVKLTNGNKTWTGSYNSTDKVWNFSPTSDGSSDADLIASTAGTTYGFTFVTVDEGDTPAGNPLRFEHANPLTNGAFEITLKGTVTPTP